VGKVNTKWIQDQLHQHGITQRELATRLKRDPAAISLMLHGKRLLRLGEASTLARLLGVPLEELMTHMGLQAPQIQGKDTVTVRGWVDGDFIVHWDTPKGAKVVPRPANNAPNGIQVVRFQTIGSKRESIHGALAYFMKPKSVDTSAVGRLNVIKPKGIDSWYFGVLQRGYSAGAYSVSRLDGEVLVDDCMLEANAPVLWLKM